MGPRAGPSLPISTGSARPRASSGCAGSASPLSPRWYTRTNPIMAEWLNSWATEFAAETPDCLHTATFYPALGPGVCPARDRRRGPGLQGSYPGRRPLADRSLLAPVWAAARGGRNSHRHSRRVGPHRAHTRTGAGRRILRRHPALRRHRAWGSGYRDFMQLALRHRGVYLDHHGVHRLHRADRSIPAGRSPDAARAGRQDPVRQRLPNIPCPYRHAVESIVGLGLGDDWCLQGALRQCSRSCLRRSGRVPAITRPRRSGRMGGCPPATTVVARSHARQNRIPQPAGIAELQRDTR